MVDTAIADRDPSADGASQGVERDLLDTSEAGPRVIRGSLLRLAGYVFGTLATVASSAVVIRHLGVVDTGRFITVSAIAMIVSTVSDLGLTGIAVRDYSAGPRSEGRQLLRNLLGMRLAIASVGVVVALLFALAVNYPAVMVAGTAIAGAGAIVLAVQQGYSIPLQVGLRFGWVAGLQLAIQVGASIEAVLLVLAGAGLTPFFALQLPLVIPALIVTVAIGGHDARVLPAFDWQAWRRMVGRVLPYSAAVVLSVVYFQIAQVMVSVLSSASETGYFGVAFRVLVSFTALPPLLVSTALPLLARAARDDAARFGYASRKLAETMTIAGAGVAVALFLGAGFAVEVVGGGHFGQSVDVLRILSVALLGTFVIGARGYALLSLDRLRAMLISNAVALLVVVGAGAPLIRAYGATGAAIAMVAAELSLALCYEIALSRERPELRLTLGFILRVAVAAAVAIGAGLGPDVAPVAAAVIGTIVYGAALLALGIVPPEIRDALIRRNRPATGS